MQTRISRFPAVNLAVAALLVTLIAQLATVQAVAAALRRRWLQALLVLALPMSGWAQFAFITNADNTITIACGGPSSYSLVGDVTIPTPPTAIRSPKSMTGVSTIVTT